jgi:hypothetical protein
MAFSYQPNLAVALGTAAGTTLGSVFANCASAAADQTTGQLLSNPTVNHHVILTAAQTVQKVWREQNPGHESPKHSKFTEVFITATELGPVSLRQIENAAQLLVSKENFSDVLTSSPLNADEWEQLLRRIDPQLRPAVPDGLADQYASELRAVAEKLAETFVYRFLDELATGDGPTAAAREKINLFLQARTLALAQGQSEQLLRITLALEGWGEIQEGVKAMIVRSDRANTVPHFKVVPPQPYISEHDGEIFSGRKPITTFLRPQVVWDQILKFIESPNPEVSFGLVSGDGGIGKTRMAIELTQELAQRSKPWEALVVRATRTPFNWELWDPKGPTLLIFDYGHADRLMIAAALESLSNRTLSFPVRLLILDRTATTSVLSAQLSPFNNFRHRFEVVENQRTDTLAMTMPTEVMIKQMMVEMYDWTRSRYGLNQLPLDQGDAREYVLQLQSQGMMTPLFAMMFGYALAHGENQAARPDDLIRFVISHEWHRIARRFGDVNPEFRSSLLLWLAAATATGVMSAAEFFDFGGHNYRAVDWRTDAGETARRAFFTLFAKCEGFTANPVRPDIIGETLVAAILAQDTEIYRLLDIPDPDLFRDTLREVILAAIQ